VEKDLEWSKNVKFLFRENKVILCNFETKEFVKLRREAFEYIEKAIKSGIGNVIKEINNKEESTKFAKLVDYLTRRYYLATGQRETLKKYSEFPKMAYYEASGKCNLKCQFCYANPKVWKFSKPYRGDTSLSKKIIKKLQEINVIYLIFSGGEPLLREDLFEIIQYSKKFMRFIGITTNGLLLDKDRAKRLIESGVDYVQVSIESCEEKIHDSLRGRGTFKKCIDAIEHLKNAGFSKHQLYITSTITKLNRETMMKFTEFAEELGVQSSFSFFQPVGRAFKKEEYALTRKDLLGFFYENMKRGAPEIGDACINFPSLKVSNKIVPSLRNHCGMIIKTLGVKEYGDIVPCHLFFSSNDLVIGNILDDEITRKLVDFLNQLPTIDEIGECKTCDIRYFCGNGCWATVYWHHKNFNGKNPYCSIMYDYFSSIIWNLGEENEAQKIYTALQNLVNS